MEYKKVKAFVRLISNIHRQGSKRNIFIFSTPRSGSTWLMELMLTQHGMKPCDEPFNIRRSEIAHALGIFDWDVLYSDEALPTIERYINSFVRGDFRGTFRNLLPWQQHYRFFTDRIVFKILHAGEDRIDWFLRTFNAQAVYLIRHPIPVALSREELPRLWTFINSPYARHFTSDQLAYAKHIAERGSYRQKAVLDWCFQNAVPVKHSMSDVIFLTYEQLVLDPSPLINLLSRELEFNDVEKMMEMLSVPSGSVSKSTKETADALASMSRKNKAWLIEKWRDKVGLDEEKMLMEVLDVFCIDVYQCGSYVAADKYWVKQQ